MTPDGILLYIGAPVLLALVGVLARYLYIRDRRGRHGER